MTAPLSFADKPTPIGDKGVLRPPRAQDVDNPMEDLLDSELIRLTGTHSVFTREEIVDFCATRAGKTDRFDLTVLDRSTGAYLGGLAITQLDVDNRSCGFRIALRTSVTGRGYGTD